MSDKAKILGVYAAFGAGLLLSIVPLMSAAFLSLTIVLGVLIAGYIMRGRDKEGLLYNHMSFVIRTIWVGGLIATITTIAGGLYLFYTVDNTPLDPCINKLMYATQSAAQGAVFMDVEQTYYILSVCFHNYISINLMSFFIAGAIAAVLPLVYFLAKYAHGLRRALDGRAV